MLTAWLKRLLRGGARRLSPKQAVRRLARRWSPHDTILLDYPVRPRCRWPVGAPHGELWHLLDAGRDSYAATLASFLPFAPQLEQIPAHPGPAPGVEPCWVNGWMPALDGVALYCLIGLNRPARYFEIGSGNSTKFAARAVKDNGLTTRLVSIDPQPRTEIDALCERVVRAPVEEIDSGLFDELEANDILYVDNSHRSFMNSDATVVFLEIVPRLKPGVIVQIHDITLPYDYPPHLSDTFYSEQYLLACYLLARGTRFEVLLPSYFVSHDGPLKGVLEPLWAREAMRGVETHGCSFWFRMR